MQSDRCADHRYCTHLLYLSFLHCWASVTRPCSIIANVVVVARINNASTNKMYVFQSSHILLKQQQRVVLSSAPCLSGARRQWLDFGASEIPASDQGCLACVLRGSLIGWARPQQLSARFLILRTSAGRQVDGQAVGGELYSEVFVCRETW